MIFVMEFLSMRNGVNVHKIHVPSDINAKLPLKFNSAKIFGRQISYVLKYSFKFLILLAMHFERVEHMSIK